MGAPVTIQCFIVVVVEGAYSFGHPCSLPVANMKKQARLFCIVFDLHYLCKRKSKRASLTLKNLTTPNVSMDDNPFGDG